MTRSPFFIGGTSGARMTRSPFFIGSTSEKDRATRIGIARICVGSIVVGAPRQAQRIFGLPKEQDSAAVRLLSRLFGIRNITLGAWAVAVRDRSAKERRLCYQINAAVDAADLVVLAAAGIRRQGLLRPVIMSSILGSSALLAWLDLLDDVG